MKGSLSVILGLIASATVALGGRTGLPNFVVIFIDDWGWGDLGANWPKVTKDTPNLDQFAQEGLRFTDWHAGASVCTPSRAALLTGRLGLRTGVTHNFNPSSIYGIPTTEYTVAQYLKQANYATQMIGKWHLGTHPEYHPTYKGFDHYLGLPYSDDMGCTNTPDRDIPPITPCPYDNGSVPARVPFDTRMLGQEEGNMFPPPAEAIATSAQFVEIDSEGNWWAESQPAVPLYNATTNCSGYSDCSKTIIEQPVNLSALTSKYRDQASAFIANHVNEPWFLYAPQTHVHVPLAHSNEFANKSKVGTYFGDTLLEADSFAGAVYQTLKATGQDQNTLVIITGDNGPWNVKCEYAGSQGPYTGDWQAKNGGGGTGKFTLWEGGHREVGVAWWPGKIKPGVTSALASSLDIVPTLTSLAQVSLPTDRVFDGIDLSDVFFGKSDTGHTELFHPDGAGQLNAWRYGEKYKLFSATYSAPDCGGHSGPSKEHDPPLVFDLSSDIQEANPITLPSSELQAAIAARDAKVNSTKNTFHSYTNYSTGGRDAWPCCNPNHVVCRCTD